MDPRTCVVALPGFPDGISGTSAAPMPFAKDEKNE